MRVLITLIGLCSLCVNSEINPKLLGIFQKCKPSDDVCMAKAIENAINKMDTGISELNIPSINPSRIESLVIGAGSSAVHLDQNYKDVSVSGFNETKIIKAHLDLDKKTLEFSSLIPNFLQKASYEINGNILVAPVRGKGTCYIGVTNMVINHHIAFTEETKGGEKYLKISSYTIDYDGEHAHYQFDNLFDGNKVLGDNINKLINDEWRAVFEDVRPGYCKAYAAVFKNNADRVFSKIPIKHLFL